MGGAGAANGRYVLTEYVNDRPTVPTVVNAAWVLIDRWDTSGRLTLDQQIDWDILAGARKRQLDRLRTYGLDVIAAHRQQRPFPVRKSTSLVSWADPMYDANMALKTLVAVLRAGQQGITTYEFRHIYRVEGNGPSGYFSDYQHCGLIARLEPPKRLKGT